MPFISIMKIRISFILLKVLEILNRDKVIKEVKNCSPQIYKFKNDIICFTFNLILNSCKCIG